jgi:hypothetical protein
VPRTKANVGRVVRYVIGSGLVSSFYEDVLHIHSPYGRPVHEGIKEYNETGSIPSSLLTAAIEIAERVPVAGSIRYGKGVGGAIISTINDLSKALISKDATKITEGIARLKGIPFSGQAMKMIKRWNEPLYDMILGTKEEE